MGFGARVVQRLRRRRPVSPLKGAPKEGATLNRKSLEQTDPDVYRFIKKEEERQETHLELIASENFASPAVLAAMGTCLTNKYAEGYPGKRYYGGCCWVDEVEELGRQRAKALFGAEHANLQPHAGAQANMAAYFAVLEPGDLVLGMDLTHGGHLTHGSKVNFSGMQYDFVSYGVDKETELIDYRQVAEVARQHRPKLIVAGATAYPRQIDFGAFRQIADEAGAVLMVDMAHIAGLVAAGLHPNPVPHAHIVTTTTHKTLRGPRGGMILCTEEWARAVDRAVFPGIQGGPLMHVIAAKAVCLHEAMTEEFRDYQKRIIANARALAEGLLARGFRLVSGGTDNHLMLVDLTNKGITGKEAEAVLDSVRITANKNTIPFDPNPPMVASGLRLGTPALTTRGMGEKEMDRVADLIDRALSARDNEMELERVRSEVAEVCSGFPLYRGSANRAETTAFRLTSPVSKV